MPTSRALHATVLRPDDTRTFSQNIARAADSMASPKSAYSLAKILRSRYGTQHPPHAERCSHSHTRNQFRHQFGPFGDEQSRCVPPFFVPERADRLYFGFGQHFYHRLCEHARIIPHRLTDGEHIRHKCNKTRENYRTSRISTG